MPPNTQTMMLNIRCPSIYKESIIGSGYYESFLPKTHAKPCSQNEKRPPQASVFKQLVQIILLNWGRGAHTVVHVCRGQRTTSGVIPQKSSALFVRQVSSLT